MRQGLVWRENPFGQRWVTRSTTTIVIGLPSFDGFLRNDTASMLDYMYKKKFVRNKSDKINEYDVLAEFDEKFYRRVNLDINFDKIRADKHFLSIGVFEGRRGRESSTRIKALNARGRSLRKKILPYVDRPYYLKKIKVYLETDLDPVMSYFFHGHKVKASVTPAFDIRHYVSGNRDVESTDTDPVVHYFEDGWRQARTARPGHHLVKLPPAVLARARLINDFIDADFYREQVPSINGTTVNLGCHYLLFGGEALPTRSFNPDRFAASETKPVHLSWFEEYLIRNGDLERLAFHDREVPGTGELGGANIEVILPPKDWRDLSRRLDFEVSEIKLRRERSLKFSKIKKVPRANPGAAGPDMTFVEHIRERAQGKILSCDIWDTVLRRVCHPEESKLRSARTLWLLGSGANVELLPLHPVDLYQARRVAEAEVANNDFEFRFQEMAKNWLDYFDLSPVVDVDGLTRIEERIETSATVPDETVQELLKDYEGRQIAVSDFYHSKPLMSDVLAANGFTDFDEIYVSCDYLKTKREGSLFNIVMEKERVAEKGLLHIGDSFPADFVAAMNAGIDAELYVNPNRHDAQKEMGDAFWRHVRGDFSGHAERLSAIVGFDPKSRSNGLPALALALSGFASFILENSYRQGVEQVFFFAREGALFKHLCELAAEIDLFDLERYPECKMLDVSRRATFAPSLAEFNAQQLMRIWRQYSSQSLAALAKSLNVDDSVWRVAAQRHGLAYDEIIETPWEDDRVIGFLNDQKVRDHSREQIWAQRHELKSYLESAGFSTEEKTDKMVVDIGWRGSIQDNLSFLSFGRLHGCYLGVEALLNDLPARVTKSGYLMDVPAGRDYAISEYAAMEFLFTAPGGSVTGYHKGRPVREVVEGEERTIEQFVLPAQDQIVEASRRVMAYMKDHGLVSADLRSLSQLALRAFLETPDSAVANAFMGLHHNEMFGAGEVQVMRPDLGVSDRLQGPSYSIHAASAEIFDRMRWPAAFVQSDQYTDVFDGISAEDRLSLCRVHGRTAAPSSLSHRGQRVAIYAPPPIWSSGGHRTIYNFAKALDRAGYDVVLYLERRGSDYGFVEQQLAGHAIKTHDSWINDSSAVAAVATVNHSSSYISGFFADDVRKFYFVQDNESEFNPMSDEFVRGEMSYTFDHMHLCVGNWLPHFIRTHYGGRAIGAGLGVDTDRYRPIQSSDTRRGRVAFLYQPEKPRRMSGVCIEALTRLKETRPDTEVVVYGSEARPDLPFDFEHLGLVAESQRLNALYNTAAVGLCVSLTNPSRIPYEMMAAGCVPIDVYRYNTLFDYMSDTAVLAYQSPTSIASALCFLLEETDEREVRSRAGIDLGAKRSLRWETDVHVNAFEAALEGNEILDNLAEPTPTYTAAPHIAKSDRTPGVEKFLAWQNQVAQMR